MNKCSFIGRFTKDPELKTLPNGETSVVNFTLAVDRKFKKEGQPTADFLNFVAFGKPAEIINQYCQKGNQFGVSSRVQTRNYEDKDGVKRYITEYVVEEFTFVGSKNNGNANNDVAPFDTGEGEDFEL